MNRYAPHVYVIPEDDADRQVADGFVNHHQVNATRIKVMPPPGGWRNVLETFQEEYTRVMRNYPQAHVVLLIDFDDDVDGRRAEFDAAIPDDLKARVFVVGAKDEPEMLKRELRITFEGIGQSLADDCAAGVTDHWDHDQLHHNDGERERLVRSVKPFLFC